VRSRTGSPSWSARRRTSSKVVAGAPAAQGSTVLTTQETSAAGSPAAVEIINHSDPGTEKMILEGLELRDKALAEEGPQPDVRLGDIVLLEDRAVQLVLRSVEGASLAVALKSTPDEVREKILTNLSSGLARNLVEEMEAAGPTRMSSVRGGARGHRQGHPAPRGERTDRDPPRGEDEYV